MTLTALDVGSLSTSLSRWEVGEYICAGLVTIACAGEYVAEFKNWFTDGIKERKDRLAKRSTLLLIVALSLELICLVRTNTISGILIGSLSDKAEKADTEAQSAIGKSSLAEDKANGANANSSTALSQANDALTKAGKAAKSLGKAEDEANKAQTASYSAMTLAKDARQEADSFEKDITSAKKQAADAESHLAEALNEATTAQSELNRLKTPRSLLHDSQWFPHWQHSKALNMVSFRYLGIKKASIC